VVTRAEALAELPAQVARRARHRPPKTHPCRIRTHSDLVGLRDRGANAAGFCPFEGGATTSGFAGISFSGMDTTFLILSLLSEASMRTDSSRAVEES
jgi:hypothetical protein